MTTDLQLVSSQAFYSYFSDNPEGNTDNIIEIVIKYIKEQSAFEDHNLFIFIKVYCKAFKIKYAPIKKEIMKQIKNIHKQ